MWVRCPLNNYIVFVTGHLSKKKIDRLLMRRYLLFYVCKYIRNSRCTQYNTVTLTVKYLFDIVYTSTYLSG